MVPPCLTTVYQHPLFRQVDLKKIFNAHAFAEFKKGDSLLQEGQTAHSYYIMETGLARSFVYDIHGHDITTGFFGDGDLIIEVASLFQRLPTKENIHCLTNCRAWKIDYNDFQDLFHSIPALTEWGRAWMAYELYRSKRRATEMITETAAKRYTALLEERPQIIQQAPLKHIASFLGITDTSLSRIRREL